MGQTKIKPQEDLIKETEEVISSSENNQGETEEVKPKKRQKPGKAKPRSKKYQEVVKDLDRNQEYNIAEAIEEVKKASYSKFPGSLEIHINTKVEGVRGLVSLPYMTGKKLTILVFGDGAKDSGADIVGDDDKIEAITKGKIDFDILITTPQWMPKLARTAKTLGPKGLMPNPKNGTITDNLKTAVESFQAGKTEYRTENKAPVIHLSLGKLNQPTQELLENTQALLTAISKSRIKKAVLAPTMGPSFKLDISKI